MTATTDPAAAVDAAFDRAARAQEGWASRPVAEREEVLRAFAELLADAEEAEETARVISGAMGKPLWEARTEVGAMKAKIELTLRARVERATPTDGLRHLPLGVVAVIGPFNFPGHLPHGQIAPALLAGNAVVLKPSELAPGVAERMADLWARAGLPAGALAVVTGGAEVGAAVVDHPDLAALFFTGSREVGVAIHRRLAGRPEVLLALELGGNNPLVVHELEGERELAAAVAIAVLSAYLTSGQRCTCARRLVLTEAADPDAFVARLRSAVTALPVGAPDADPPPFLGPVVNEAAAARVLDFAAALEAKGATPLVAPRRLAAGPAYLAPGLLDVTPVEDRPDVEVFGPLLQVVRVADLDAAIAEASATSYGLAAGIVTRRRADFERFRDGVRAGALAWNRPTTGASGSLPFGGVGLSGNHRPAGFRMIDACVDPVAVLAAERIEAPAAPPVPGLLRALAGPDAKASG